jgi:hypothetical protein
VFPPGVWAVFIRLRQIVEIEAGLLSYLLLHECQCGRVRGKCAR